MKEIRIKKKVFYPVVVLALGLTFALFYSLSSPNESLNVINADSSRFSSQGVIESDEYNIVIDEGVFEFVNGVKTKALAYNEVIPGPILKGKVGDTFKISIENKLSEDTTIHWHGLQVKNEVDGVPFVTQNPIKPGESKTYEIELRNSGLYWYHSHFNGHEQVESGLQGVILIEDPSDENFDDEYVMVLDDVLLDDAAEFYDFRAGRMHGRFGNIFLVNGEVSPEVDLSGGNVRFRIVNTANARSFNLKFGDKSFTVIGKDIGRVDPYEVSNLVISPGERYDIYLRTENSESLDVLHSTSRGDTKLAKINFEESSSEELIIEKGSPDFSFLSEVNEEPDFYARLQGFMNHGGLAWSINGKTFPDNMEVFEVEEGEIVKIRFVNTQGQPHPMHLHGQKFVVLSRNGIVNTHLGWEDTTMVNGGEVVDIAFVAEEKGEWAFHCHILEHAEAGMMSLLRVV